MSVAPSRAQNPDSPGGPSYMWEVPGKPVTVRISLDVVDRLEREAVENFRSISSRGSEIGGILLGNVSEEIPACVSIEDYEPVSCDYNRGPLYHLSDADLGRFDAAIERRAAARGLRVLGFYRSHTRKGLCLDAEDMSLFNTRFGDPRRVALLVRPYATKPSVGAVFIWENGQVRGEASYMEFPFQSAQLASARAGARGGSAAPALSIVKPGVRTPPRVEIAPPEPPPARPPVAPEAAPPPAPARAAEAAPPAERPAPPETPRTAVPPAPPSSEAARRPDPPAAAPEDNAAKEVPAEIPMASAAADVDQPAPRRTKPLFVWGAVAAALLACSGALFVYPGVLRHTGSRPLAPLTLRVEHSASDLLLTWNRDCDAVRSARRAMLEIFDGDRHENIEMSLNDLHNGSILYSPLTADVSFRMEITGADQSKIANETVRVLRTRPSPMPQEDGKPAQASAPPAATPSQPAQTAEAESQPAAEEPEPVTTPNKASSPARPFNPSSLAQRLRPALPTDLPDAPSVGTPSAPAARVNLGVITSSAVPMPAAPAPNAVPAAGQSRSSQLVQAEIISRKPPVYPQLARQTGAWGEVRLVATVGADGRVKDVKVLSGHPLLQRAAADAVRTWVYKPATLNGVPVETQSQVVVNFSKQ